MLSKYRLIPRCGCRLRPAFPAASIRRRCCRYAYSKSPGPSGESEKTLENTKVHHSQASELNYLQHGSCLCGGMVTDTLCPMGPTRVSCPPRKLLLSLVRETTTAQQPPESPPNACAVRSHPRLLRGIPRPGFERRPSRRVWTCLALQRPVWRVPKVCLALCS